MIVMINCLHDMSEVGISDFVHFSKNPPFAFAFAIQIFCRKPFGTSPNCLQWLFTVLTMT